MIRESSLDKPATQALRDAGVKIRVGDVTDDVDKLKTVLAGVDILISAVYALLINDQKGIIRAAKELGTVQRVIPCDFGTHAPPGIMVIKDQVSNLTAHRHEKLNLMVEAGYSRVYSSAGYLSHLH